MKYTKEKANTYNCQKENGITLIALIITIIVMLILVAVSVSVALNGGLFDKATTASKQMEEETIYEDIISSMHIKNNGDIDIEKTFADVQEKYAGKISNINPGTVDENTLSVTFDIRGEREIYTYTIKNTSVKATDVRYVREGRNA